MSFCQSNIAREKHEAKVCPRCSESFICKRVDITNCACFSITLLKETLNFLQKTNYDYLCPTCLEEINQMVKKSLNDKLPNNPNHLLEGVHFYYQNGCIVFTEYYHLLRGYCCQSGCRHCAYGYGKPAKNSMAANTPSRQVG